MNTCLTVLRDLTLASSTLDYLTDAYIVPEIGPAGCPTELIPPAVIFKDGTITRNPNLQMGKQEVLTIQGGVIVEGHNPRGEYGVIIGDPVRAIKGTAEIIADLAAVFDGNVTGLDNATDCFLTKAGPSVSIVFGDSDVDQSFWQLCPFEVQIKRRTLTQF